MLPPPKFKQINCRVAPNFPHSTRYGACATLNYQDGTWDEYELKADKWRVTRCDANSIMFAQKISMKAKKKTVSWSAYMGGKRTIHRPVHMDKHDRLNALVQMQQIGIPEV